MNAHIAQRLAGIQAILNGVRTGGGSLSSATKGRERKAFVGRFLSQVLPPAFRFGSGDITDLSGMKSGQIDVVVEYSLLPSLPVVFPGEERLYLAEGVAAAVEVKSDLASQWDEVKHTAQQLSALRRQFGGTMTRGKGPLSRVPLFAVGYTGWKKLDTIAGHLGDDVDGILVIDAGLFVSTNHFCGIRVNTEWSLWGLIQCLHQAVTSIQLAGVTPLWYALSQAELSKAIRPGSSPGSV